MHTTITLPTTSSAERDEEALVPEGLYGPPRWLEDRGISSLLARFAELAGTDARRLASLLPKNARDDRQNNAPRIIELLRAASRIDGLTLEGYVIRAPRRDERVSIDTVLVPESAIIAHTGAPIDEERYPSYQNWLTLASVLGLGEDAIPPDEMRVLIRDGSSTRWWWAWWD